MSVQYPYLDAELALPLLSALAAGLLIGIERGWHQREQASGSRVAGIRTFTLIGGMGALVSLVAVHVSQAVAAVLLAALLVVLVTLFLRAIIGSGSRDATTMVASLVALGLGLLGGAGYPAFAIAGAAVTSFILAVRRQSHAFVKHLTREEMQAIARYAVLSVAILPFLPDAQYGPYDAWNPFKLWLVVLLITGFSIAGYVANRLVGDRRGTIVTAMIGGAYSSTAVTASLAERLREGGGGPFSTGIALASSIMYLRVIALTAILAPVITVPITLLLGAPTLMAFVATAIAWRFETGQEAPDAPKVTRKPFALLPAFVFLAAVAGASLLVNWAQAEFGEAGGGLSLFIAGSFDVDAAIVAFSALPEGAVAPRIAALALAGTVGVNMAFKTGIVLANARWRSGRTAALALMSSLTLLIAIVLWEFIALIA